VETVYPHSKYANFYPGHDLM